MSESAAVNQIMKMHRRGGKAEVLVQWACSWASLEQMEGQAVAQVLDTRVRDGVFEALVMWACTWTEVDNDVMAGDLWQQFLDEEAKNEADEDLKKPVVNLEADEDLKEPVVNQDVGQKRVVGTVGEKHAVRRSPRSH